MRDAGVVVPKSAMLWINLAADFGTMNHTRKQWLAGLHIDPKVRKVADPQYDEPSGRDTDPSLRREPAYTTGRNFAFIG